MVVLSGAAGAAHYTTLYLVRTANAGRSRRTGPRITHGRLDSEFTIAKSVAARRIRRGRQVMPVLRSQADIDPARGSAGQFGPVKTKGIER
jgi:hypothetical protein